MDFSSSSEEKLIRESLKKLLESFSSEDYLKKFDSHRYDPALLSELINQGFIVDQDTNKINFDVIKILSEELGYSNSPLNPSALVSDVLITLQESSFKGLSEILKDLLSNKLYSYTSALNEPLNFEIESPKVTGKLSNNGYELSGTKILSYNLDIAKKALISFITDDGVYLALIETDQLEITSLDVTSKVPYSKLNLDGVIISKESIINKSGEGLYLLKNIYSRRVLIQASLARGMVLKMLELTAAYTSEREQFDRPIGSFQAVSHRAANMFIDHQELDLNLQQASYLYNSGSDLDNQILKPNYNPMSMMPWTARKLLWNPGPLGKKLGQVCLEAFDNKEDEFGKTVINILEREYGKSSLKESLKVRPLSERKLAHSK